MMMEPPVPGRLPPLKLLHGQAALDLDTPPPSPGVLSPDGSAILMIPMPRPRHTTFSAEEIDHSMATLDQCFQILSPGKYPALHTHGRVSSAFIHNKYSVTLADRYAILQDLMVNRSRLLFNRDCCVRVSQLSEYVNNIKVIVHEEYQTLQQIMAERSSKVFTKLEYLPSLCEDFRLHLNHYTSLQHRVRADKWLQPLLVTLCRDLETVHDVLRYWQDHAIAWLHRLVEVGLWVFAHCPPGSVTQDMLWSIVRGIEDFNTILRLARQRTMDAASERYGYLNIPPHEKQSIHCSNSHKQLSKPLECIRPFSVHRIIAILAKERAKPAAYHILNFFSGGPAMKYAASHQPMPFDWFSYTTSTSQRSCSSNSSDGLDTKPMVTNAPFQGQSDSAIFSLKQLTRFDSSQDQCPVRAIEAQEDDLLSKFLIAVVMATSLLQHPHLKSDSSTESNSSPKKRANGKELSKSPTKKRGGKHESVRKSVHWGDSLDSNLKDKLFGKYLRQFWQLAWRELMDLLHRPSLTTVGKAEGTTGHVYLCNDLVVMSLIHTMEKACDQGQLTPGCEQSLYCVTRELHSNVSVAFWDTSICLAQASAATDKCLPATISHSEEGSRTCQFFQQSYSPLLSLLIALEQDETIRSKMQSKVKNGITMSLQNVIPMVMTQCFQHALLTLDMATHWSQIKSHQFLASWSVEQFLLILQSDIKVTTDTAVTFLKIIQSLTASLASPSPDSSPTRSISRCNYSAIEQQRRKLARLRHELDIRTIKLHNLCGQCNKLFQSDCSKMCVDYWRQNMPIGKVWRRKTTEVLPSEHNPYASSAVETLLVPLLDGVSKLKTPAQISVISIAVTTMLETWMAHVLKEKPKFSFHGAHQLEQDFSYLRRWISSEASGLSAETRQSVLSLEVFRHFDGAILLLKQQPRNRGFLGVRTPSKEDLASEYSSSTAPSAESHRGSLSDMSDSIGPMAFGAVGGTPLAGSVGSPLDGHPPPIDGSETGESGFDEETFRIPNRREWLSLRVHGNKSWKLPFGACFNSTMDP